MIADLFSHKIHATDLEDWERRLVLLAAIFQRFDGQPLDRDKLDDALKFLAPTAARSPFRDQYSIYLSILGVGQIVWRDDLWIYRLSDTARAYLLGIEPDVESFCKLQLALYQRPDGRGQVFRPSGRGFEHASGEKTLELMRDEYRVCPIRLILKIFQAKALLDRTTEDDIEVSPEEIYTLVNSLRLRSNPSPNVDVIVDELGEFRAGRLPAPQINRRTFKFLESTGLLACDVRDTLRLMPCSTENERLLRNRQISAIRNLEVFFDGFQGAQTRTELGEILKTGEWASYFDAVRTLPTEIVEIITGRDVAASLLAGVPAVRVGPPAIGGVEIRPGIPAFTDFVARPRPREEPAGRQVQLADPEQTRIKRERRNTYHELILRRLVERTERLNLRPKFSGFVDLVADVNDIDQTFGERFRVVGSYLEGEELPYFPGPIEDGLSFLFEVKSTDDDIVLSQVRKAISQLYEYRYRYAGQGLRTHVILTVALQARPNNLPWVLEYLVQDRKVAVCWLDEAMERVLCPEACLPVLEAFVDGPA
jgi:hypothetical protein